MAHDRGESFALLAQWMLAAACTLAVVAPSVAQAQAWTEDGGLPTAHTTPISVTALLPLGPERSAVVEAIEFELDQAGYPVVRPTESPASSDRPTLELRVRRDDAGWELRLVDRDREQQWTASGGPDDSPTIIGVYAVELVYASVSGSDPSPVNEAPLEPTSLARPSIEDERTSPSAEVTALDAAVVTHRDDVPDDTTRRWGLGVAVAASNLGLIGARLGVRRRWSRFELGLSASAGYFSMEQEHALKQLDSSQKGQGFFGAGPVAAFMFRTSQRVRPLVGVESPFVVPIVASRYEGLAIDVPGATVTATATSAGIVWSPGLSAGLEVGLGGRLALRTSLRAGPVLSLRDVRLSGGGTIDLPPVDVTGAVGLAF